MNYLFHSLICIGFAAAGIGCNVSRNINSHNPDEAFSHLPERLKQDTSTFIRPERADVFLDKALLALMDSALKYNPAYLQTIAEINKAKAALRFRKNALLPTFELQANVGLRRFGEYTMDGVGNFDTRFSPNIRPDQIIPDPLPDYSLLLRAGWEIDIWGQLRKLKGAAAFRFEATLWMNRMAQTQLVADISELYYQRHNLANAMQILKTNASLQEKAADAIQVYYSAGRVPRLAVQQLEAQLNNTRALHENYQRQWLQVHAELLQMTGNFKDTITNDTAVSRTNPLSPGNIPLSPDVLIHRPDVIAAEHNLAANGLDVKAARAALLPTINLNPVAGFNSFRTPTLFTPAAMVYQLLGGLTMPLFQQHLLKTRIETAKAEEEIAFQQYRETLLKAFAELFVCVKTERVLQAEQKYKQNEVDILQSAVASALSLFTAGQITYLEVYSAQQNVLMAQLELQAVEKDLALNRVRLYRVLGGG